MAHAPSAHYSLCNANKEMFLRKLGFFSEEWLILLLAAASVLGTRSYVDTEEFINDLDKPIPMTQIQGVLGDKAAMPCDIHPLVAGDEVSMVLWFKEPDGEPLYSYDIRNRPLTQPKLWSSPSGFGSRAYFRTTTAPALLMVNHVKITDVGVYRCRVDFKNSPTRNLRLNFTVIIPPDQPVILDAKTRGQHLLQSYSEGDTLELICEVNGGNPRPQVVWCLEDTVIDDTYEQRADDVTTNTLTFPNLGRQHLNARLVCQASNTNLAPPQIKHLALDLNLRPLTVQILNKGRQLSADVRYEIECQTTGSRPEAQVTWWKGSKQLRRSIRKYSEMNSTASILTFVPEAEDHEKYLVCRAENSRVLNSAIEDTWKLDIHYVPMVTMRMGLGLNPGLIKEGEDVYFECSVKANPKAHRFAWYKDNGELHQNASGGVILSDQSLVLQSVSKVTAGDYSCVAYNTEGRTASNSVSLDVRYAPICKSFYETGVYGTLKHEPVLLRCAVDSNPPPTSFSWTFNSSGEQIDLTPSSYVTDGWTSLLNYTPSSDTHFGAVWCSASNVVGRQETPCVYNIVAAGPPMPPQNCSVVNQSTNGLLVDCLEGFDGGLQQSFFMEVLTMPSMLVILNVSSNHTPIFEVQGLSTKSNYLLNIYSANSKGRSEAVSVYTTALMSPDKHTSSGTSLPVSPMLVSLLVVAALLFTAVCGVITAIYRRQANRRLENDKQLSAALGNSLYMDSFSKQDNTYTASPKVDYCNHYQLKTDNGTEVDETDPDIIPCHYDKKSLADGQLLTLQYAEGYVAPKIYLEDPLRLPINSNSCDVASAVSRGVTARGADIAAATRDIVTTNRPMQESRI